MNITYKDLEKNKVFRYILDNVNDGVNVVNLDGILIYTNKISADYAGYTKEFMLGQHVSIFYPDAVLLEVLKTKQAILDKKIHYVASKRYAVNAFPLFIDDEFAGSFSIFKDVNEIDSLNRKIKYLEVHLSINKTVDNIASVIGNQGSLKDVMVNARRTVAALGGPRHSIIIGESGTGKTMLAKQIYNYAKDVGILSPHAPFIEINCGQFTNSDIAAVEIFGSEKGAYTDSVQKKGLFEQAHGGILFLDESHALEHYQTILLKAIESGKIRRIGGSKEIYIDVIVIAASTQNLKEKLLPELYQRLAQYELYLPPLRERKTSEKIELINHFIKIYESAVTDAHNINYKVSFSEEAESLLLRAVYPRNIRQLRDIINYSIDAASPLISDISFDHDITTVVESHHLPFELLNPDASRPSNPISTEKKFDKINVAISSLIQDYRKSGMGPRKISNKLKSQGYHVAYYQVAYHLKILEKN